MTTGLNFWDSQVWVFMMELSMLLGAMLFANMLRRLIPLLRRSLIPSSVLAGFMVLIVNGLIEKFTGESFFERITLETLTYHGLGLGFVALALKTGDRNKSKTGKVDVFNTGVTVVATYLVQAIVGLAISMVLAYLIGSWACGGLLVPMGYGQGPGQANNIGSSYEALGFSGGRSFGMAIAAAGYLCACTVGVVILNRWKKKGLMRTDIVKGVDESQAEGFFQDKNEIPITDSIDKLSIQAVLVLCVYLATYLVTWGLTSGIAAISAGLGKTVNSLLWGFNFIIGSVLAMLVSKLLSKGQQKGIFTRQYQNNYLLNRLSGFFFDLMIVAGIASINPEDISGLWLPFVLMVISGGAITFLYLKVVCKKTYGDYYKEGLISMYGMLTGTIGSGILLLREMDPELGTPAANNLVTGSSYAIVLGAPLLAFVSLAAENTLMCFITLGLVVVYGCVLTFILLKNKKGA